MVGQPKSEQQAQQRHAPSELFRTETQMKGIVEQVMGMLQQQAAPAAPAMEAAA